eukprot:g48441.t1
MNSRSPPAKLCTDFILSAMSGADIRSSEGRSRLTLLVLVHGKLLKMLQVQAICLFADSNLASGFELALPLPGILIRVRSSIAVAVRGVYCK